MFHECGWRFTDQFEFVNRWCHVRATADEGGIVGAKNQPSDEYGGHLLPLESAREAMTMEDGYGDWEEREHQLVFFRWVEGQIVDRKTHYITLGVLPNDVVQVSGVALRGYHFLGFRVGMPDIYW